VNNKKKIADLSFHFHSKVMDENRENQRSLEAEIDVEGATPSTPTLGRDATSTTDDQLFPSPWKMPARVDEELTPRRVSSSSLGHRRSDVSTTSNSRLGQEEDTLTVEKSRILEQLRNMTTEVDQLESRLQAVKRRRARAANSALQKLRETQESEVQEMRYRIYPGGNSLFCEDSSLVQSKPDLRLFIFIRVTLGRYSEVFTI
jgi:hypothetical protein